MEDFDEKEKNMNEKQKAIYSILEVEAMGLKASRSMLKGQSASMHEYNLREFIDKAKEEGLGEEIITKYERILGGINN